MKFTNIKIIVLGIVSFILLFLALPEFSFQLGSNEVTFPRANFYWMGVEEDFGSLQIGEGLEPVVEYKATVAFENNLADEEKLSVAEDIAQTVQERIEFATIPNSSAVLRYSQEEYAIFITLPQDLPNRSSYINLLTAQGQIRFLSNQAQELSLYDYDIMGEIRRDTLPISGVALSVGEDGEPEKAKQPIEALRFSFDSQKELAIRELATSTGAYPIVVIDGGVEILQTAGADSAYQFNTNSAVTPDQEFSGTEFIAYRQDAISPNPSTAFADEVRLMKIIQSYFLQEEPLEQTLSVAEDTRILEPAYKAESLTTIAISAIVAICIIFILVLRQLGMRKTLYICIASVMLMLILIVLLKTAFAELTVYNIPVLTGLVLLFVWFSTKIFEVSKEEYAVFRSFAWRISAVLFAVSVIPLAVGVTNAQIESMLGVVLVAAATLMLGIIPLQWLRDISIDSFITIANS